MSWYLRDLRRLLVLLAVMNTALISLVAEARPFVAEWIERIAHCDGDRSVVEYLMS